MSDRIARARTFALDRHQGQLRKGSAREPFATHLEEVAQLVERFGGSEDAICAAWLHDTVEDCPPTTVAHIDAEFGPDVAGLVAELTDDKALPKAERKRLQIANAAMKSPEAALLKICDKISNVGSLRVSPPVDWDAARKLAYVDWATSVIAALPETDVRATAAFRACAAQARAALRGGA